MTKHRVHFMGSAEWAMVGLGLAVLVFMTVGAVVAHLFGG